MKARRPAASSLTVTHLTCEYLMNPLGIETRRPRLSWMLESSVRGARQSACQILVAGSEAGLAAGRGDFWDTGKVRSDQSIQVPYGGRKLRGGSRCWWKVRVWDQDGRASDYSPPSRWEMGLLGERDWKAQWVAGAPIPQPSADSVPPSPILRKVFELDKSVKSARAIICGLGYYELHINGRRIGDNVLDPAFTRYDKRVLYTTYDVTESLFAGRNAVGVMLGNGWYNCHTKEVWNFQSAPWLDRPKMICQLEIEFTDGSKQTVVSDTSWKASAGPVVFDGLRNGESYNARLEKPGWATADHDDAGWDAVQVIPGPGGVLRSQVMTPIKVMGTIAPVAVKEVCPGVFVYDMGQNFAGWAQLTVSGPAGTKVTLTYSERVTPDGDIDPSHIRCFVKGGEFQTDHYILKGQGTERWEPRFTYHGFQYVQVTGFPGTPGLDNLRGRVVHTAFSRRGEFACSDELLNKIQTCALWSTVSNYHGIPTDCPHREKNGWTGDAQLSAEQVLYNFDPMTAYAKWMDDFRDVQRESGQLPGIVPTGGWGYNWGSGPAWDSAYILIPWYLYRYCGDTRILEEHYEGMKRYVDFMTGMATEHIVSFGLGDWCPPVGGADQHKCPSELTSTGYYYADAKILSEIARLVGKESDARKYADLAEHIKRAFTTRYYDPATGMLKGETQTSMACALYQGLFEETERGKILAALVAEVDRCNGHLECGILGAKYVMHCLTDNGRTDVAYGIATQRDFPSWGHWIQQGATTLWESWDGGTSQNHHMFSDISAWFYKALGGIRLDPLSPAFKHAIIRPDPVAGLSWARAEHRSMYGPIRTQWRKQGSTFALEVTVPPNTTATVHIPTTDPAKVTESGKIARRVKGIEFAGTDGDRAIFSVESGRYAFEAPWKA